MDPALIINWLVGTLLTLVGLTVSAVVWGVRANGRIVTREISTFTEKLKEHSDRIESIHDLARKNGWDMEETEKKLQSHADRIEKLMSFANQVKATHNSMHPSAKINGL